MAYAWEGADGARVLVTVNNADQAWARAATDRGDKGGDAAHACLAMVALGRRWKKK